MLEAGRQYEADMLWADEGEGGFELVFSRSVYKIDGLF